MNYIKASLAIVRRDLSLIKSGRSVMLNAILFFSLVILLFAIGLGTKTQLLQSLAPTIIWVAMLLASLLSIEHLFRVDYEDGTLEQLLLLGFPLHIFVMSKLISQWMLLHLPLIVIAGCFAVILNLPAPVITSLIETLLLGTPILLIIGSVGVALSLSFPQGGLMLSVLIIPFYIPVLIFACSAVELVATGQSTDAQIDFLLAMLFLAIALGPLATAAALKMSIK